MVSVTVDLTEEETKIVGTIMFLKNYSSKPKVIKALIQEQVGILKNITYEKEKTSEKEENYIEPVTNS